MSDSVIQLVHLVVIYFHICAVAFFFLDFVLWCTDN